MSNHPITIWRKRHKLSQTAAAKMIDVSQPHLSSIETGAASLTLDLAGTIVAVSGGEISFEDLWHWQQKRTDRWLRKKRPADQPATDTTPN